MQAMRFIPTCVGNTAGFIFDNLGVGRFIPTCVGNTYGVMGQG